MCVCVVVVAAGSVGGDSDGGDGGGDRLSSEFFFFAFNKNCFSLFNLYNVVVYYFLIFRLYV